MKKKNQNQSAKKVILSLLLALLIFSPAIFSPTRSQAFAPDVVVVNTAKWVWERVKDVYEGVKTEVGLTLINNAVDTFVSNFSYEMANFVAQGAIGGKPLFRTESVSKSLQKASDAALGNFVGELTSKGFTQLGINLCDPSIDIKLTLTLKLIDTEAPPPPKCNWREVQNNWKQFGNSLNSGAWTNLIKFQLSPSRGGVKGFNDFFNSFSLKESDLGALQVIYEEAQAAKRRAEEAEKITQEQCQGYKDQKTAITEEVRIHCQKVHQIDILPLEQAAKADADKLLSKAEGGSLKINIRSILGQSWNIFTKTLSGKLMQHYIRRGMWTLTDVINAIGGDSGFRTSLIDALRGGTDIRVAPRNVQIFTDLKTTDIRQVESYSLLDEFAICPNQEDFRHPDNCTVSVEFLQLLPQKRTIVEAIREGLLAGDLTFIGPGDARNNSDNCYLEGLCYHNLVKLRKAGVISVGWELAAQRVPLGSSVTIQKVIDCFEDRTEVGSNCAYGNEAAYDNHNPYYHLIDPNWVLKAPAARCQALVYGPTLESSESSSRQQYCADVQTCLREDGQGNCLDGQYGYCTLSENIWRFNGDLCEQGDIYSGCLTFQSDAGDSNSYIEGSLEYCTADQVGCKRYTPVQNADGDWLLEADYTLDPASHPTNDTDLFLNNQAGNCPSDKAGCSEFIIMAPDRGINLLANGDFNYYKGVIDDGTEDRASGWAASPTSSLQIITPIAVKYGGGIAAQVAGGGSITATVETGYALKNRSFVLSFKAYGITNPQDLLVRIGSGIGSRRVEITDTMQNYQVSGTFPETAENSAMGIVFSSADTFVIDQIKLEEVNTFDYERRREPVAAGFSPYGEGGRVVMNGERTMCTEDEVGCQGYQPLTGDPMVPGIVTADDLCPAECVGYATFAEQTNIFDNYEGEFDPDYYNFIPTTAFSCPSTAVGCEEFTNLDEVARGGEGKEYFTYLRQCVPSGWGETYYTWEGLDVAGYQIVTWTLLPSNLGGGSAPCTNVDPGTNTCIDDLARVAACGTETPDPYDDPEFDPNCREYFDTGGNSHYRLQDRVIYATDDCHPYRRTFSGQEYQAVPNLSQNCAAEFAGCRAYTGAAANNQRRLFVDNFENGTFSPWVGDPAASTVLDLSNESLANNGHSLKITSSVGAFGLNRPIASIQNNKSYQLSWWMKNDGTIDTLQIGFVDEAAGIIVERIDAISAGQWRRFDITSQPLLNLSGDVNLWISINGSGAVYIDNFIVKELIDSLSYVRNSWQTPASCDDPFAGAYLGCQAYRDTNNINYNLKSFTRLCREQAIGCQAVIDTHNSTNPFGETFNTGDYSQITVPEDSITYLVPDVDKYCQVSYKGCMALGNPIVNQAAGSIDGFTTAYKINNPDNYKRSLCQSADLYCEAFNSDKGTYYFKNPGNQTCTYQENVNIDGELFSTWFTTESLADNAPISCGPRHLFPNGWAATCPASKNLCTTFVDPNDPAGCDYDNSDPNPLIPDCRSYYYYNNDKINDTACGGLVDQNSGCILAYDANDWNANHSLVLTRYDSLATYANNVALNRPVGPETTGDLDTNRLIKVNRDRQCAEWLACKSLNSVYDADTNQYKMVCEAYDSCLEYSSSSNLTQCRKWGTYADTVPLTVQEYQSRIGGINNHIQWSDKDYLGYSIPGLFPLKDLTPFDFSTSTEPNAPTDMRLAFDPTASYPEGSCPAGSEAPCNITIDGQGYDGICREQTCWINPTGSEENGQSFGLTTRGFAVPASPYPRSIRDDEGIVVTKNTYNQANYCETGDDNCEPSYKKVTYGLGSLVRYYGKDDVEDEGLCSFVDEQMPVIDGKAKREGESCDPNIPGSNSNLNTCGVAGRCEAKTKIETFINWEGICLQYDLAHQVPADNEILRYYCNSWYPAEQILGSTSRFNHFVEAGFYNPAGQDVNFCAVGRPFVTTADKFYCLSSMTTNTGFVGCSMLAKVPSGSRVNASRTGLSSDFLNKYHLINAVYEFNGTVGAYILRVTNPTSANHDCQESGDGYSGYIQENQTNGGENGCFNNQNLFTAEDFFGSVGTIPVISINDLEQLFDTTDAGAEIEYFFFDEGVNTVGNFAMSAADGNARVLAPGYVLHTYSVSTCDAWEQPSWQGCPADWHQAFVITWYGGSHCGAGGPRHKRGLRNCNPLPYNYYLSAQGVNFEVCDPPNETDCSDSVGRGIACLNNQPYYPSVIASSTPCTNNSQRNDFPEGCFKKCVADKIASGAINPANAYCSQYGALTTDFFGNPTGVTSCLDNIFYWNGSNAQRRDNVTDQFFNEVWYWEEYDAPGCIQSPIEYCRNEVQGGYPTSTDGTLCSGINCFQQCNVVSAIDVEGDSDKSWVRTDIWWRAQNPLDRPHIGPWQSYYYSEGVFNRYVIDGNVRFSDINGNTIRNFFGADQGTVGPGTPIITTEVPIYTGGIGSRHAATFFSLNDLTEAGNQLKYLFASLYSYSWNDSAYISPVRTNVETVDPNTFAGPDYNPKILRVCGGGYCESPLSLQGITVNNINIVDNIEGDEGDAFVTVKFYYYAHPDHMPVTDLRVNWDDGSISGGQPNSKYKNNMAECRPTQPAPHNSGVVMGFGGTDNACHEGYKTFYHAYTWSEFPADKRCSARTSEGAPNIIDANCYKPTVYVRDNWYNPPITDETSASFDGWVVVYEP